MKKRVRYASREDLEEMEGNVLEHMHSRPNASDSQNVNQRYQICLEHGDSELARKVVSDCKEINDPQRKISF